MPEERTTSSTGGQKGVKLARFDLIPAEPLIALAEHYGKGARKYAPHQWRAGYELGKSYASIMRHATEWMKGNSYDVCSNDPTGCQHTTADGEIFVPIEPDTCYNHTGSHHMIAIAWHSLAIHEMEGRFPEHDDRYRPELPDRPEAYDVFVDTSQTPLFTVRSGYEEIFMQANPPLHDTPKEDPSS